MTIDKRTKTVQKYYFLLLGYIAEQYALHSVSFYNNLMSVVLLYSNKNDIFCLTSIMIFTEPGRNDLGLYFSSIDMNDSGMLFSWQGLK